MSSVVFHPDSRHSRIVFLTGAGLSARTGLGTFRGAGGLWALDPRIESAMHADQLPDSLPELWQVWGAMATTAARHGPTPGHYAIARMGAPVITQNVDGLHQAARSEDVAELHGRAYQAVCMERTCTWRAGLRPGDGPHAEDHGVPSRCPVCDSPTRPDVVLFDEQLPPDALDHAYELATQADLFVAVGTSGAVFPAAQLAPIAKEHGARTVLIDIDPPHSRSATQAFDEVIARDAHEVLPEWERPHAGIGRTNPFLEPFG